MILMKEGCLLGGSCSSSCFCALESALSFLGLGSQPPEPSWGNMINTGRGCIDQAPWISLAPGIALFFTVFIFNLLGDGLRDILDPKLNE